jgi:hypothetical protein
MYVEMNAWREILARIFEGFTEQDNVSPAWLINPATKRRLKLDKFFPEAGIAIRFIGLMAKGQGRQSDWEVLETEQRDQTRVELCRMNGVQLVLIDPADDPVKQIDNLSQLLARASRTLAQSERPHREKQQWMPALSEARNRLAKVRALIGKNTERMMANLAESWRDREVGRVAALESITPAPQPAKLRSKLPTYLSGQRVNHERFGAGVITKVEEGMLSILFDAEQERTFAVELVQDKLALEP